jgi:hypothetical protein
MLQPMVSADQRTMTSYYGSIPKNEPKKNDQDATTSPSAGNTYGNFMSLVRNISMFQSSLRMIKQIKETLIKKTYLVTLTNTSNHLLALIQPYFKKALYALRPETLRYQYARLPQSERTILVAIIIVSVLLLLTTITFIWSAVSAFR